MDTTNMFRVDDTGIVDGTRWYTVWAADGPILDWVLSYDTNEWVNHEKNRVDMTESMLTILKLKFSDREIPNPYLHVIPTGNLFFGIGAEADAYREHVRDIQATRRFKSEEWNL